MMIFLILIVIIVFAFLSVDIVILFSEWQSRIHIGRWNDRKQWQEAIEKRARIWLGRTPTVRMTGQNRLILLDIFRGEFRNTTIQKWQTAGLILGLSEDCVKEYVKSHNSLFFQGDVTPEDFLLAYSLKKHACLSEGQEKAILSSCQSIKNEGTMCYRPWVKDIRFVDTLGMVLPLLHSCGWDDLAIRQLQEYDAVLLKGIYPAHAYHLEKKLPLGVYDWSRGIGWYILALIETADMSDCKTRIIILAEAMLNHQNPDGGFSCFVFNSRERMESSGTVLVGLLFLSAYRLSGDKRFFIAALNVEKALMKSTRRNGALDNCQGDTYGIGYYSRVFSIMPFAQGLALRFSKELDKYINENA